MTRVPVETAAALQRPVWLRAAFTAAFGIFATFWTGNEDLIGLWGDNAFFIGKVVMAAFFIVTASMVWEYAKSSHVPQRLRTMLAAGAALWTLSGAVLVLMGASWAVAVAVTRTCSPWEPSSSSEGPWCAESSCLPGTT